MEKIYRKRFKFIVLITSGISVCFFLLALYEENVTREWRQYQRTFKSLRMALAEDEKEKLAVDRLSIQIRQIALDGLRTTDRCTTCHLGIADPACKTLDIPFKTHSQQFLQDHPVEEFGCTVCHGGYGALLEKEKLCAPVDHSPSRTTILPLKYAQSRCGVCHLAIFTDSPMIKMAPRLVKGIQIIRRKGCLSCHSIRGTGGVLGPELTRQGEKTRFEYDFQHVTGEHTGTHWLQEHFVDPQQISPGSQMFKFGFNENEIDAMTTLLLGLTVPDFTPRYLDIEILKELKGDRKRLMGAVAFNYFCATCHGAQGEGQDQKIHGVGFPRLNNQDFLAVASHEMLEYTLRNGRGDRMMTPWAPKRSGLQDDEIQQLLNHVRKWKIPSPEFLEFDARRGDVPEGRTLFKSHCSFCHGGNGEGGLGPALNNQDLLILATRRFLFDTIVSGRANTAMPSWSRFTGAAMEDILAFIRQWQRESSIRLSEEPVSGDAARGKPFFNDLCSRCHGEYGQGGVGPAILNRDFLNAASDHYIIQTISRGHRNTGMVGWHQDLRGSARLNYDDIHNIVVWMRNRPSSAKGRIYSQVGLGDPRNGRRVFRQMCAKCHGEKGEGKIGPALNNQEFLACATNGFLQATIAMGRADTAMPSWARWGKDGVVLNTAQINDVVTTIRSWQKLLVFPEDIPDDAVISSEVSSQTDKKMR